MTIGAAASSSVTSKRITARWRCVEADHPLGADPDPLAARRPPDEVAGEHAGAEVDRPLVVVEVGFGEQERFVVDVELDQFGVGHVDDRLTGLREGERVLGVLDLPRLVEPVDVGAVGVGVTALLGLARMPR